MYSMSSLTSCGVCEANSSIMFYGSSSGASMSLPSKSRLKRQSRTFTQVCVHEHTHTAILVQTLSVSRDYLG